MEASDELRENIINRLKRIEGQTRGIQRMILEKRPCHEIVSQLRAARAAMDNVTIMIIDSSIENCISEKIELQEIKDLKKALRTAVKYE
jgi:DNA-binding FrmR family transcriptional regulator